MHFFAGRSRISCCALYRGDITMFRAIFLACLVTLTCLIVLTSSLGFAETDKVKTAMAALKAETAKNGEPTLRGDEDAILFFGDTMASNEMVDAVVKQDGGDATLFVKRAGFWRQATTTKNGEGSRALWTELDITNPAFVKLIKGEAYYGELTISGTTYEAGYEPIIHAPTGTILGAYFVGQKR
jgi:cache 3/cache 2 fusion protein